MREALAQMSPQWSEILIWLFDASIKVTVLAAIALTLGLALRHAAARYRHTLYLVTLLGMLAAPALSMMIPGIQGIALPTTTIEQSDAAPGPKNAVDPWISAATPAIPATTDPAIPENAPTVRSDATDSHNRPDVAQTDSAMAADAALTSTRHATPIDWARSLGFVWLTGLVGMLAYLGLGLFRARRVARRATHLDDHRWNSLLEQAKAQLGTRARVRMLMSPEVCSPLAWGVLHPLIVLPSQAEHWDAERVRLTLIHELVHIKRMDWIVQMLGVLVCAVYWFNPLVWRLTGQLCFERERSCDEQVLMLGAQPSTYAGHLLEIARGIAVRDWTVSAGIRGVRGIRGMPGVGVQMARRSTLERRLRSLRKRVGCAAPTRWDRIQRSVSVSALAVIALGLCLVQVVGTDAHGRPETAPSPIIPAPTPTNEAREKPDTSDFDDLADVEAWPAEKIGDEYEKERLKSLERPAAPGVKWMVASVTVPVTGDDSSIPIRLGDGRDIDMSWTDDGAVIHVVTNGRMDINRVHGRLNSLEPGASLRVVTSSHESTRRLVVEAGDNGSPWFAYEVDGKPTTYDADVAQWLSQILAQCSRRISRFNE